MWRFRRMRPVDATDAGLSFSLPICATQACEQAKCLSARTAVNLRDPGLPYSKPLRGPAIAHSGGATFGCWRVVKPMPDCRAAPIRRYPQMYRARVLFRNSPPRYSSTHSRLLSFAPLFAIFSSCSMTLTLASSMAASSAAASSLAPDRRCSSAAMPWRCTWM